MLSYSGPPLKIKNLMYPEIIKVMVSLEQFLHSEEDKSKQCKNYPTENFESYKNCDEDFVYKSITKKYNIVPFWATNNLTEVTSRK